MTMSQNPPFDEWTAGVPVAPGGEGGETRSQNFEPDYVAALDPDQAIISSHLYRLFAPAFVKDYPDARIEIAWASPATDDDGPNEARTFSVFDIAKASEFAKKMNERRYNVYVGVALRRDECRGRAGKEDVTSGSRAWADFDKAG